VLTTIRKTIWLFALLGIVGIPAALHAQSTEEPEEVETPKPIPIGVAMVSGIERSFKELDYIADSIGQPILSDLISGTLANVEDLKGIDRSQPLGLILFLKPGSGLDLFPKPAFAGFLPCDNFDDLMVTISSIGQNVTKLSEAENRYSASFAFQKYYLEEIGDHVFFTPDETLLDAELPDPSLMTETLSTRYDAALQLNIKNVPVNIREILLTFVRSQMEIEMQQRDEEAEGPWRMRKASLSNNLRLIEQLGKQGESLTIGLDVSRELRKAVVEIDLNAKPGSQFAKYLGDTGGVTSYFRVLQDDPSIISAYASWELQQEEANNFKEIALGLKQTLQYNQEQAALEGEATSEDLRLDGLFDCLAETAEAGTLDLFARMQQVSSDRAVIMASIRVINGNTAAVTIADLLELLKSRESDNVEIALNVDSYRGVNFHQLIPTKQSENDQRIFGEDWSMYFGAGERTLWFVLGGEEALPTVHTAIDKILDPASQQSLPDAAPFRFTLNMSEWMSLFENPDRPRREFGQKVAETFAEGDDRIIADMTPKENGIRYRIRLEEGFVKIVGIAIARGFGIPLDE